MFWRFWQFLIHRGRKHRRSADKMARRPRPRSAIISSPTPSSQERLRELACWIHQGRRAQAELELFDWLRQPDCPVEARVLLASLWACQGQTEKARLWLKHLPRAQIDELIASHLPYAQLLLALKTAAQMPQAAWRTLMIMDRHHGHDLRLRRWINAMDVPGRHELPRWSPSCIEQLANELLGQMHLLPTLVQAQKIKPNPEHLHLLRLAGARLERDLHQPRQQLILTQAMAELAALAGDVDDARRWAHRGLRIDPYCASLALILARMADDTQIGPPALQVLSEAVQAHPRYSDLQAALIRREQEQGHTDSARLRLHQWMQREPNQPLAQQLAGELAA